MKNKAKRVFQNIQDLLVDLLRKVRGEEIKVATDSVAHLAIAHEGLLPISYMSMHMHATAVFHTSMSLRICHYQSPLLLAMPAHTYVPNCLIKHSEQIFMKIKNSLYF